MKKSLILLLCFMSTLSYSGITNDNSSNYLTWTNGSNGGTGFGSWSFSNTGNAGQFLASSASQGFGNIDVSGTSFGLYGNTTGSDYSNSSRDFSTALEDGNTFKISLAVAYRNGNKGINLYEGVNQRFNFNVGSDLYTAQGSDLGWAYSQTSIIVLEVTQLNSTTIVVRLTRGSDIYNSGNITTTGRLTGFKLYCGNTQSGDLNNLFANSLEVRVDSPLPVELTSFTALINNANVQLNWQTATEVNNYGFSIERASTSLGTGWEKIATSAPLSASWKTLGFVQGHGNSNSPKNYSLTDTPTGSTKFQYRLKQIDFDGKFEYSHIIDVEIESPTNFSVQQNYPNPFNPETTISYTIAPLPTGEASVHVMLTVYDVLGREIATLVDEYKQHGNYQVTFNARHLERSREIPSGIYFYRLQAGDPSLHSGHGFVQTKKMLLIK